MGALTAKFIEQVKPGERRREIPDTGGRGVKGLYFILQPSGARSWALRYRYGDKSRKLTIGSYPAFGLVEAREAAAENLRMLASGRDPASLKRAGKSVRADETNRVERVLDEFYRRHVEANNRPRTAEEIKRMIDGKIKPAWKNMLIQDVTRRDVLDLLDRIVDGGAPITANRVFALLRKFFNWCLERGIVEVTPCATLKAPAKEVSRDRVLTDAEIKTVWQASDALGWPFGPLVKLLLLTGQRREEVAGASWDEFELDGEMPVWTIAKERVKNGREHIVPLSPRVIQIINELPRIGGENGFVLTTTSTTRISGFSRAKAKLDKVMLEMVQAEAIEAGDNPDDVEIQPWRIHDLRRTAASGMARLGQSIHVVEKILNHTSGTFSGIVGVYQRHHFMDERRRALNAWADYVLALVNDERSGNVVKLSGSS